MRVEDFSSENFEALLNEFLEKKKTPDDKVVKGRVIAIDKDSVTIDVGLKSEGRIPLREFTHCSQPEEIRVGDDVHVYIEKFEDRGGEIVLSREKARREAAWIKLEEAYNKKENVMGEIFGRVKGGFTVDLSGAIAFLPGSQVDVRPIKDAGPLIGMEQPFQILKMDRSRGNIVVSRRAVLEESRAEARSELVANIQEGQVLTGVVKNITDYGAFIDLGGVDGLLHLTDISWKRINTPHEVLSLGQSIQVQVIKFNKETQRISLGMKQLESNPWDGAEVRYAVGTRHKGRISNITEYGAFVEMEPGIEGLVHVTEMSWTKKNLHPGKIVSTSQEVEVVVLDVEPAKRRISLGMKQCSANPWELLHDKHPVGSTVEGEIRSITEFGLFVALTEDIDGMVHMSDLSWEKSGEEAIQEYKKGQVVTVRVLEIDAEKERISLGIKQLSADPFEDTLASLKKGSVVHCEVVAVLDTGLEVSVGGGIPGFIKKSELSRDKSEQKSDRFSVGDKVEVKVTNIDKNARKLNLSVKALELDEEKQAMAEFGSSDSGATLGDILGAALNKSKDK